MEIILASASSRRRELLAALGIPFAVEESGYEEDMSLPLAPKDMVERFALAKANAVAVRHPGALVIGADTVVAVGGVIFGKPFTNERATEMLRALSGKEHSIYTGVALVCGDKRFARVVETKVRFRALSDSEIDAYVATGEPLDKAGAYALQGGAAPFIESIVGDQQSGIGLPVNALTEMLHEFGVNVK